MSSERGRSVFQKIDELFRSNVLLAVLIGAIFIEAVLIIIAINSSGDGWSKNFGEFTETLRNWFLMVGGFLGLAFAWSRLQKMDRQNEISANDDARQERTHIRDSLQHAVKLLQEPTDSMKYLAIAQLEQLGTDYPTQTLEHAVRCMCGQAKEYSPFFSEHEEALIRRAAREAVDEYFWQEVDMWRDGGYVETKPTEEGMFRDQYEGGKNKLEKPRFEEMRGKLVGAINRLACRADELKRNNETAQESEGLIVDVPIDLRGVDIHGVRLTGLEITPECFSGCGFREVTFKDCNFVGAFDASTSFENCQFERCTFARSNFERCRFFAPRSDDSVFVGSSFNNCTFERSRWEGCDFNNAKFRNIKLGGRDAKKEADGLIPQNIKFFVDCDMTNVQFEIGQGEIEPHLRWNYQADDFGICFVSKRLPVGLDAVRPKIVVRPSEVKNDPQHFTVVDDVFRGINF